MKKIHLSFDDGPHATNTPKVLDILSAHGITATFFVVGERLAAYGALTAKAVAAGHRVGNHSFDHSRLTTLTEAQIRAQINDTETELAKRIPIDYICRPPYGAHDAKVDKVLEELGYRIVMWSVDTEDWKRKPDGWVDYGVQQIQRRDTSLVLMHDLHQTTADNLDTFIKRIKALGDVEFVDLHAVTNIPPPVPGDGGNDNGGSPHAPRYYVVLPGDTLSSISRGFYGTASHWKTIYEANRDVIADPNVIRPGMRLLIPRLDV